MPGDYEEEDRRFYKLAIDNPWARGLELSDIFWFLHKNFAIARKPLNFIPEHCLHRAKRRFFGL